MGIMSKLPGINQLPQNVKDQFNDKKLVEIEAIINSMTPKERRFPDVIRNSQKRRIAMGSGTSIQAINQLLKQFIQMQKMMKKMSTRRHGETDARHGACKANSRLAGVRSSPRIKIPICKLKKVSIMRQLLR